MHAAAWRQVAVCARFGKPCFASACVRPCHGISNVHHCRYIGIHEEGTGNISKDVMPKSKSMAAFRWTIGVQGFTDSQIAISRVDNVRKRGVPFPNELTCRVCTQSLHHLAYTATAGIDKSCFAERGGTTCECAACVYAHLHISAKHIIYVRIECTHVACARVGGE